MNLKCNIDMWALDNGHPAIGADIFFVSREILNYGVQELQTMGVAVYALSDYLSKKFDWVQN